MKIFGTNIDLGFTRNISRLFWTDDSELRSIENPLTPLGDPAAWFSNLFGSKTKSGVNLTESKALGLSAVWAAINIKASMIASLPINVFKVDDEDNRTKTRKHAISRLLKRPYKHLTSYQFRFCMQALLELRGNAFAQIIRNPGTNRPIELKIIKPSIVRAEENRNGSIIYYWKDSEENRVEVSYLDMIHLRGFACDADGVNGLSPITMGRENLSLAAAAQDFEAAFFGNGAHAGGVFTYPGVLTDDQKKNIRKSIKQNHTGLDKVGKNMILEGDMKYHKVGLTPAESMLGDSRRLSIEDVARWFNVPVYMLGALDKMSFSNIEQIARDFINKSLRPLARNWEEELEMKLFRKTESMDYEIAFDFAEILKGDSKQMSEYVRTLTNAGTISINEGRKMIGKNTIPGDWANQHWLQLNTAPTDEPARIKYTKNGTPSTGDEPTNNNRGYIGGGELQKIISDGINRQNANRQD